MTDTPRDIGEDQLIFYSPKSISLSIEMRGLKLPRGSDLLNQQLDVSLLGYSVLRKSQPSAFTCFYSADLEECTPFVFRLKQMYAACHLNFFSMGWCVC